MSHRTAAAAAALPLVLMLAAPLADAGVVISTYTHGVDEPFDPLYRFKDGPFGQRADAFNGAGFYAAARAIDVERSRLPTGPGGATEFKELSKDSGRIDTTTKGQTALASASLTPMSLPALGPAVARAQSGLFENHAVASTSHQLFLWNSRPVNAGGQVHAPETFYVERRREATAESAWYDSWTATGAGQVNISLALDGRLLHDPFCSGGASCNITLPAGTDSYRSDKPYARLDAMFIVYDLDQMMFCDDRPDECGSPDVPHPLPMSILTARYEGDDDLPIDFLHEATLGFQAIAGHRYLAMGLLEVEGQDGGVVDFFHTLRITGMALQAGVLRSAGTGGDLSAYFAQPPGTVPVPATLWLLLLGGGAMACTRHGRLPRPTTPPRA